MEHGQFVSLKAGNNSLMWKLHSLHLEIGHCYSERETIWGQEAYRNKPCYFLNLLPQAQNLFKFLSVPLMFIVSLPKKYKSCLLWPLPRSCFYETSMFKNYMFFLLIYLLSILSLVQGVEEGNFCLNNSFKVK